MFAIKHRGLAFGPSRSEYRLTHEAIGLVRWHSAKWIKLSRNYSCN